MSPPPFPSPLASQSVLPENMHPRAHEKDEGDAGVLTHLNKSLANQGVFASATLPERISLPIMRMAAFTGDRLAFEPSAGDAKHRLQCCAGVGPRGGACTARGSASEFWAPLLSGQHDCHKYLGGMKGLTANVPS